MSDAFPVDLKALQVVLDQLNAGVYITDRKRRILLWNRKESEEPIILYVKRPDGRPASELPEGDFPLGIFADGAYQAHAEPLDPGDVVLCYTDGVTETADADGRMLDTAGLAALAAPMLRAPGKTNLEGIYRAVKGHCGSVEPPDDVLLLSLARLTDGA